VTRTVRGALGNALLVGLALLSVGLVLWSHRAPTTLEREARAQNLLTVFRRDQVTRLEFERAEGGFVLERSGSKPGGSSAFRISAPFQEEAMPEAVDALLGTLGYATFERRIEENAVNRAAFGLDAPKLVLHVDMGEVRYRLRLGASPAALSGSSYLEVSGEGAPAKGVFVVSKGLTNEIDLGVDKFRGRQLIPYGRGATASLKWTESNQAWEIRRSADRFRFAGVAHDVFIDRDREERLFLQLARLEMERFVALDSAEAILKKTPPLKLEIKPNAENPTAVIELGSECPGDPSLVVAVRRAPGLLSGCVSKDIAQDLSVPIADLSDSRLFALRLDEIKSLKIIEGERTLELMLDDEGYELKQPEAGKVEPEVAEGRLKGLLNLTGVLVFDRAPLKQDEQTITVLLRGSVAGVEREETVHLMLGSGGAMARRSGDEALIALDHVDPALFDVSGLLLKSRQLLDLQARDIERIEVDTKEVKQIVAASEAGLELVSPPGSRVDGSLGLALVDAVRSLRALRWVAVSDTGRFGLEDPQGKVVLSVEAGEGTPTRHEIVLGANAPGGVFAALDGGGVFVLSGAVVDVLETWVLDRSGFLPLLGDVKRIRIRSPRGDLELRKSGDGYRQTGGSRELSNAEIQQLIDELGVIRAEAAVHPGPALPHEGFLHPTLELATETTAGAEGVKWVIGVADAWRDVAVYYGRVSGTDATFVVPRRHIQRILEAL
jgi:hypothetical protein